MSKVIYSYLEVIEKVEMISGHMHPGQEHILFDLARLTPDGADILEVGSFKGRSTAAIGLACLGTGRRVHTIDTFLGKNEDTDEQGDTFFLAEFLKNMGDCGLVGTVTPLIGKSSDYWGKWERPIYFLFVDGCHADEAVMGDVKAFAPLVVPGGYIAMHDVYDLNPPEGGGGPGAAWLYLLPELEDVHRFHNLVWGRRKNKVEDESA